MQVKQQDKLFFSSQVRNAIMCHLLLLQLPCGVSFPDPQEKKIRVIAHSSMLVVHNKLVSS